MTEVIRAEKRVLKHDYHLKPNITREVAMDLKELRQDKDRVILTVDKGVAMVVLDKQNYTNTLQDLLASRDTYRPINS